MTRKEVITYWVHVYVAGDLADAKRICRRFCMHGACVTVTPTEFIYTGGQESGVCVGFVNYPRFPAEPVEIFKKAELLAEILMDDLCQTSALIQSPDRCLWMTTRDD
jgi:hypothetical protein